MSAIDRYLAGLDEELRARGPLKRRILAEVEDHLRDAARDAGEEEAVRRFGPVGELARQFAPRLALSSLRTAALVVAAVIVSVPMLYPLPENLLPPAPWPEDAMPAHLAWKQDAVIALFLAGVAAGLVALAGLRRPRLLWTATVAAYAALVAMATLGVVLSAEWADAVPGTPSWLVLIGVFQLALLALAGVFLAEAVARRRAGGTPLR